MIKTILVTGGNRGIGREICRQLAIMGHRIILCSRDFEKGRMAADDICGTTGILPGNILVKKLDVTDEDSIRRLEGFLQAETGKLDVLINNAGINGSVRRESDLSKVRDKIQKDYGGLWKMVKAVQPVLEKAGITGKRFFRTA